MCNKMVLGVWNIEPLERYKRALVVTPSQRVLSEEIDSYPLPATYCIRWGRVHGLLHPMFNCAARVFSSRRGLLFTVAGVAVVCMSKRITQHSVGAQEEKVNSVFFKHAYDVRLRDAQGKTYMHLANSIS